MPILLTLILLTWCAGLAAQDADSAADAKPKLVWSDEFEGNSLDYSKWGVAVEAFGGGNNELQIYTDRSQNVRVEDGHLILEALHYVRVHRVEPGSSAKKKIGKWAITPNSDLPNVLILGDSISIGYTPQVREILQGKANVYRPIFANGERPENCDGTTKGVTAIDRWLDGHDWDVIHFNFGLHDLKHVHEAGGSKVSDSMDDPRQADPETYRKNLAEIVKKLKATDAKLIYATTTGYPAGVSPARLPADAKIYNDIAIEIMNANGIEIDDLHALCQNRLDELQLPKNVHFNEKGQAVQAEQVAKVIEAALEDPIH